MPVFMIENDMPYTELLKWIDFFKKHPVGWREDHRTVMLMKAQGVKARPEDLFASLRQISKANQDSKVNDRAIPSGLFLQRMLKAKGGDSSFDFLTN